MTRLKTVDIQAATAGESESKERGKEIVTREGYRTQAQTKPLARPHTHPHLPCRSSAMQRSGHTNRTADHGLCSTAQEDSAVSPAALPHSQISKSRSDGAGLGSLGFAGAVAPRIAEIDSTFCRAELRRMWGVDFETGDVFPVSLGEFSHSSSYTTAYEKAWQPSP